ncbi:fibrobacter succinogenes major paralogous domain-containing protein [Chryseobacterium potabilaquae]|uniref:Uncharacterized protein n=1 Tax=Chryseobacterium potabilaquae TaxID=2675057 RepID=A0A6N4X9T9_9FLAO|nr:FISUMP domain-containing protein [Chryseobacterium potabilaquae]CAA7197066.1 hypothetical protein CHRY9293_03123 [Chryseobacterium potabilaquae]
MENKFINLERILSVFFLLLISSFYAQVRIANSAANQAAINSSAFIDASSNPTYNQSANVGKGLLYPRTDLTTFTAFSGVPVGIANSYPYYYDGFMVFNTSSTGVAGVGSTEGALCRGFWYYDNPSTSLTGGTWKPFRPGLCSVNPPVVTGLNCSGAINAGSLTQGVAASGVNTQIPYTGGNGESYPVGAAVSSTGVTGLTATLQAGILANGNGTLTYTITGTPSSAGTATFDITFGGQSCSFTRTVDPSGSPVVLNCSGAVSQGGDFIQGIQVTDNNHFTIITFTGGSGSYPAQSIPSTGVLGLTAALQAGNMSTGQLIFVITGVAASVGTASFTFTFEGQTCTFTRNVVSGVDPNPNEVVMCGSSKAWMTHNLGANPNIDPNSISAELHGDKYKWGRATPALTQAQDQSNFGAVSGWATPNAPYETWGTPKSQTDPCPAGFKVPTSTDYAILRDNNTITNIGFSNSIADHMNYGAVVRFYCPATNNTLQFPVSGMRSQQNGELQFRAYFGMYWNSEPGYTNMSSSSVNPGAESWTGIGLSVRCIQE